MKLLGHPLPVLAALAIPQMPDGLLEQPVVGAAAVLTAVAYFAAWYLNAVGKLPGAKRRDDKLEEDRLETLQGVGRVELCPEDKQRLQEILKHTDKVYHLLAQRSSEDGVERFLRFVRDVQELSRRIVQLEEANKALAVENQRLAAMTVEILEAVKASLATVHAKLDKIA